MPTTMPVAAVWETVPSMTEAGNGTSRVVLDLVPDAEPIQGQARGVDGVAHAFAGWLELFEALDRARLSRPPRSAP